MSALSSIRTFRFTPNRLLDSASVLCVLGILWFALRSTASSPTVTSRRPSVPAEAQRVPASRTRGKDGGKVGIIEYADFQCPYCAEFAQQVLPRLSDYMTSGRVIFGVRYLPLSTIHPFALSAARAAECAARAQSFWPMYKAMFDHQADVGAHGAEGLAGYAGLTMRQMDECDTRAAAAAVDEDIRSAQAMGIAVTPTFLVGTVTSAGIKVSTILSGSVSAKRIEAAITSVEKQ